MLFNHSFVRIFFRDTNIVLSNLLCPYIIVFLSFCILFSLFVNAESSIKISNLELVDKSDNTTVVEDGTFNNLDVLMNVRFEEVAKKDISMISSFTDDGTEFSNLKFKITYKKNSYIKKSSLN